MVDFISLVEKGGKTSK